MRRDFAGMGPFLKLIFLIVGLTPHLTSPARGEEPDRQTQSRFKLSWELQLGSTPLAGEVR